jgi:hypothetical protein
MFSKFRLHHQLSWKQKSKCMAIGSCSFLAAVAYTFHRDVINYKTKLNNVHNFDSKIFKRNINRVRRWGIFIPQSFWLQLEKTAAAHSHKAMIEAVMLEEPKDFKEDAPVNWIALEYARDNITASETLKERSIFVIEQLLKRCTSEETLSDLCNSNWMSADFFSKETTSLTEVFLAHMHQSGIVHYDRFVTSRVYESLITTVNITKQEEKNVVVTKIFETWFFGPCSKFPKNFVVPLECQKNLIQKLPNGVANQARSRQYNDETILQIQNDTVLMQLEWNAKAKTKNLAHFKIVPNKFLFYQK